MPESEFDVTYFDGKTKTTLSDVRPGGALWNAVTGGGSGNRNIRTLRSKVPWLFRGTELRQQAVASIPFSVYRGKVEVDSSDDWKNVLGWMPDPRALFKQIEGSLALFGYGYQFNTYNAMNRTLGLRHLSPPTVAPIIHPNAGLVGWNREVNGAVRQLPLEDIVYFWMPDPLVEVGPPTASAGTAALAAAGVTLSVAEFVTAFFDRGAIKPTILAVPRSTSKDQKEELKNWYDGLLTGISNAFASKVLNSDSVNVTPIGEGLEGLSNAALSKEQREEISTALGVPQSKMFSSSATDSNRVADEKSFLKDTVVPQFEFIAECLNVQVLAKTGHRLVPRPQAMDEFQEDETQRSGAFVNYRQGGMRPSVAVRILGIDLPADINPEDLDAQMVEDQSATVPEIPPVARGSGSGRSVRLVSGPAVDPLHAEAAENERRQFRNYLKKGKDPAAFVFHVLDENEQADLMPEYSPLVKKVTDLIDRLKDVS